MGPRPIVPAAPLPAPPSAPPKGGSDEGDRSRAVALALLRAVLDDRRPLDEALAGSRTFAILPARDRAFVRQLVATTLRRLGQIDNLLDRLVQRRPDARAQAAWHILRLGLCQLVFLNTPAHAAVDRAVALAQRTGVSRQAGLINAVLRRAAREGSTLMAGQDPPRLNTPPWLWESWETAFDEETARAIATAHLTEAPLDLTARDDAERVARLVSGRVLPTGSVRVSGHFGAITDLPGFAEGDWWVQDAAAALPAKLLSVTPGRHVLDLCAAPGGKTAQLAAMGVRVSAVERQPGRLRRLAGNLARLRLSAELIEADATTWRPSAPASAVLIDAPCSSTGTIRRHPDIAWLKQPTDLTTLTGMQDRLLAAAVSMTRAGGALVYCVCSLQPEEGPDRIEALLAKGTPVVRDPVTAAEVGGLAELITPEGDVRTLPCHLSALGGLDGFYICRLRRI